MCLFVYIFNQQKCEGGFQLDEIFYLWLHQNFLLSTDFDDFIYESKAGACHIVSVIFDRFLNSNF